MWLFVNFNWNDKNVKRERYQHLVRIRIELIYSQTIELCMNGILSVYFYSIETFFNSILHKNMRDYVTNSIYICHNRRLFINDRCFFLSLFSMCLSNVCDYINVVEIYFALLLRIGAKIVKTKALRKFCCCCCWFLYLYASLCWKLVMASVWLLLAFFSLLFLCRLCCVLCVEHSKRVLSHRCGEQWKQWLTISFSPL